MNNPHATRILIVAADPLARAGLAVLLADQPGIMLAGRVAASDDLLAALDVYRPDVLVWDLGGDADTVPDALADLEGDPPLVALLPDETLTASLWAAGVRSLLRRSTSAGDLLAAIAGVERGLAVIDPVLAGALPFVHPEPPAADLTPRELDVLRLLAEGLPNKAIARQLDISEHTVKFHINAILGKLAAQSRTEAVVHAIRRGLIAL